MFLTDHLSASASQPSAATKKFTVSFLYSVFFFLHCKHNSQNCKHNIRMFEMFQNRRNKAIALHLRIRNESWAQSFESELLHGN